MRGMWLDVLALFLLALFAFLGARRGGLAAGLSVLTLGVSYAAAVWCAPRYGEAAAGLFGVMPLLGMPIAGTLGFLAAFLAMTLFSKVLRMLEADHPGRSPRDRFFGALFGVVRGGLVVLLLSYLALWVDALRTTGTVEDLPELGSSAAAAVTGNVVEAGMAAAMGDTSSGRVAARIAARPGRSLAELQALLEHPAIGELQQDELFWTYVEHGSLDAALNRRGFLAITHDAELRRKLGDLGMIDDAAVEDPAAFREAAREMLAELGPRIRGLREDPKLQELMQDPEVVAAVQSGDHLALMTNPGFREVVARVMDGPQSE